MKPQLEIQDHCKASTRNNLAVRQLYDGLCCTALYSTVFFAAHAREYIYQYVAACML